MGRDGKLIRVFRTQIIPQAGLFLDRQRGKGPGVVDPIGAPQLGKSDDVRNRAIIGS
jgi:hypothetical protein